MYLRPRVFTCSHTQRLRAPLVGGQKGKWTEGRQRCCPRGRGAGAAPSLSQHACGQLAQERPHGQNETPHPCEFYILNKPAKTYIDLFLKILAVALEIKLRENLERCHWGLQAGPAGEPSGGLCSPLLALWLWGRRTQHPRQSRATGALHTHLERRAVR